MLTAILAFFQAVPAIVGGLNSFFSAYFNAKTQIVAAQIGGNVQMAQAMLTAEVQNNQTKVSWLQIVASSPFLWVIVGGFALPYILYEWKCIVYDIVWMGGATKTDPIRGNLADWGHIILTGIFITTGGVGAVHAYVNKIKP